MPIAPFPNLDSARIIAFDTETDGVDVHDSKPVGYVLTWGSGPDETAYYPIRHEGGGNMDASAVLGYLRDLLKRLDLRVVMHNAAFDLWMSAKDGITIDGPVEDTAINAALINENRKSFGLNACCIDAGVQAKKGDELYAHMARVFGGPPDRRVQMANFWRLSGDDALAVSYAAGDGTSTLQLRNAQQADLDIQKLRRVWMVECALIPVLHRARLRGVHVSESRLDEVYDEVNARLEKARHEIDGIDPFDPDSVGRYLKDVATGYLAHDWDEKIVPAPPRTKPVPNFPDGRPCYPRSYLESFSSGHAILKARKYDHILRSSINVMKNHVRDGLVHPAFWQLPTDMNGTVTGRLSCTNPNLQSVPKRDRELGVLFRSVFTSPPGTVFFEGDYSQCEYRILAHYAKSPWLLSLYNEDDGDIHASVASKLGLDGRDDAKAINFSIVYCMGNKSLATQLGVSCEEARKIRGDYFRRMPEVESLINKTSRAVRQRGFIMTLLGRRRRFVDPVNEDYKAINALCQGGNADIIKLKMVEVDNYLHGEGHGHLAFSVHDSISCYLNESDAKVASKNIDDICCDFDTKDYGFDFRVRMKMDWSFGRTWADTSYGSIVDDDTGCRLL